MARLGVACFGFAAALPTENWITNGGNVFNQRYSIAGSGQNSMPKFSGVYSPPDLDDVAHYIVEVLAAEN